MAAPTYFFPGWTPLGGGRWATKAGARFVLVPTPGRKAWEAYEGGAPEAGGTYRPDLTGWALGDAKRNVEDVYAAEDATPTNTTPEDDMTDTTTLAPVEDNTDGLTTCDACATLGPDEERPAIARIEWANGETGNVCAECLEARTWDEDDRLSSDDPAPQPWRIAARFTTPPADARRAA